MWLLGASTPGLGGIDVWQVVDVGAISIAVQKAVWASPRAGASGQAKRAFPTNVLGHRRGRLR
eukprot:10067431-Lingulodinium_polyedra.AAC.1